MKWGGRKTSTSSSSSSSFISYASPFSWLSKLKHMRINSDSNHAKVKQKEKLEHNSSSSVVSVSPPHEKNGRRQGTLKLKKKKIGVEVHERKLFNDNNNNKKGLLKIDEYDREKEYDNIRRRFERKAQQVLEEQLLKLEREVKEIEEQEEEDVLFQFESPRTICTPRTHSFATYYAGLKNPSSLRSVKEKGYVKSERVFQKKLCSEKLNLKELKVKSEKQKRPLNFNREIQRRKPKKVSRVKIYSPRMVSKIEICRIKALEEMRNKAKLKMKKLEREEISKPELDSFAVIKCSLNPKQDFRDSMIEMIEEKGIRKPEEMEELLACYLTLNADEYHDLIIKVFRQVWFEMKQHGFGFNSQIHWGYYQ